MSKYNAVGILRLVSRIEMKIVPFRYLLGVALLIVSLQHSTNVYGEEPYSTLGMEEVIVEGEKYTIETYDGFVNLFAVNRKGATLYKEGRYREAIPYLYTGARVGFKMSQARLGAVYLYGLGDVDKNLEQGLGWLGVASEAPTSPRIIYRWRRIMEDVPESHTQWLNDIVMEYREKYGSKATGTDCGMESTTRSMISRFDCDLSDEWHIFASNDVRILAACVLAPVDGHLDLSGPGCPYVMKQADGKYVLN